MNLVDTNKKIFFFVGALHGGGGKRVITNIINQIDNVDYEITLLSVKPEGPMLEWISNDCRHISLIKNQNEENQLKIFLILKLFYRFFRLLKTEQPEVIITDGPIPLYMVRFYNLFHSCSFIWIARKGTKGVGGDKAQKPVFLGINTVFKYVLYRFLFNVANYIIVPSSQLRDDLINNIKLRKVPIRVVPNPINIEELKKKLNENETIINSIQEKYSVKKYFIVVNRLIQRKHTDWVIESFKKVNKQFPEANLLIAGDGPEREALQEAASSFSETIHFLGHVENPLPLMKEALALVLAAEDEGFGFVIPEAMLSGCIPIAFDFDHGPSEIIENGKDGILLPGKQPIEELKSTMLKLLNEEYNIAEMRKAGYLKALSYGDRNKTTMKYVELFSHPGKSKCV